MDHAMVWFNKMRESSIEPDITTYNTLIKGWSLSNQTPLAEHQLVTLLNPGSRISPNTVTFNTVISSWCFFGKPEKAYQILMKMLQLDLPSAKPDSKSLLPFFKAYRRARSLFPAYQLILLSDRYHIPLCGDSYSELHSLFKLPKLTDSRIPADWRAAFEPKAAAAAAAAAKQPKSRGGGGHKGARKNR